MRRCVIFCAGEFDEPVLPLTPEDFCFAADGGLQHLRRLGREPEEILGDFDSLGYIPQEAQVFPVEKDDTDSMLAVRRGLEKGLKEFIIYGGLDGPRLDHTLANFQTLRFLREHNAIGWLVGRQYIATVISGGMLEFSREATGIVSVFCQGEPARGVTLEGLQYPLQKGELSPAHPLGASNHFQGEPARISVKEGALLVLWDRENGFPLWKPWENGRSAP